MRLFYLLIVLVLALTGCIAHNEVPVDINFNSGWEFYRADDTLAMPPDDAVWDSVVLPHSARLEELTVRDQWQGYCFYRKRYVFDNDMSDKIISLQFDGAMNVAEVWVNGVKSVTHLGGYLPFVVDLSGNIRFDTVNTILVRLDNRDNPVTGPKPLEILDFNMYGGLYRDVKMIVKERVHLSNPVQAGVVAGGGVFFATKAISGTVADFEVKSHVVNQGENPVRVRVKHILTDNNGRRVAAFGNGPMIIAPQGSAELVSDGTLEEAHLWSPEDPALYNLRTEVYADGRLTDADEMRVGIRSIAITPEGMWLNGTKRFLSGVNRHQEYPYVGYAMSDEAQYRDAYKIKQAGFDFVRCSHYPMSTAFLDACDELGIMVLDAILGWQYFGDSSFEKLTLESCHELIRRDRNHPCVLAWELSVNETEMPRSFTDSANTIAHAEYPYPGCYSAGWMLQSYDIYIEARQHRHGLHADKPLLVSEYGDWEYFAQNAGFNQQAWGDLLDEERNSRQPRFAGEKRMLQQALNIQEAHNDNLSTHAFADAYWVMFDYNRGMSPEQEYSGVMDIFRIPKFSYYFFKSQRDYSDKVPFSGAVLFIASHWQSGESNGVRVFSNCDSVELFVDGVLAGRQKPDTNSFTGNLSHPPFTFDISCISPGTVKAAGYINGVKVAEESVTTPRAPERIALCVDESGCRPAVNDLFFVYASVTDSNNTVIHNDSRTVTFKADGAVIVGPVTVNAQAGIATALIHTGLTPAAVTITADAAGLVSDTIHIQIK